MPPAAGIGAGGDTAQRLYLCLVSDAVVDEQVDDIAFLEADPAALDPADLRVGRADDITRVLERDFLCLTQSP